jgi:hypothetical protein
MSSFVAAVVTALFATYIFTYAATIYATYN